MRSLSEGEVEALVLTLVNDGSARADRINALSRLLKGVAFEEEAVARLNLYAAALEAAEAAEEFSTLGLVVGGRVVRVRDVAPAPQ